MHFLVAVPQENSNITANALFGSGGAIAIKAKGIFGIQQREQPTNKSDITASSESGIQGTVEIDAAQFELLPNVPQLSPEPPDFFIALACQGGKDSPVSLYIIGRGGLFPDPRDVLNAETLIVNWVELLTDEQSSKSLASEQVITQKPFQPPCQE